MTRFSFNLPAKFRWTKLASAECAPLQPVSGVTVVGETFAVNGLGRGGYVRTEKTETSVQKH